MASVYQGNAFVDGESTRQWIVGTFMPEGDIRNTSDVEIKWGHHLAGFQRHEWVMGETRTTIAILISGAFVMEFRDHDVVLARPGDYVMWGPGVDHKSRATEDSVIITVRWPGKEE